MVADGGASSLTAPAPAGSPPARAAHGHARQRHRLRRLSARLPRAAGPSRSRPTASAGTAPTTSKCDLFDADPQVAPVAAAHRRRRAAVAAGQRAGGVPAAQRERRPAPRPGPLRLLYRLLWRLQVEPGLRADPLDADWLRADADGAGGAARHAQDEGLRALPARSPTATTAAARRCTSPGSSPSITSSRRRRRSSRAASRPCAGRS